MTRQFSGSNLSGPAQETGNDPLAFSLFLCDVDKGRFNVMPVVSNLVFPLVMFLCWVLLHSQTQHGVAGFVAILPFRPEGYALCASLSVN
ncbi:uncharacterized protein EI97DRAFT_391853, partial [Westerdykella ornata]